MLRKPTAELVKTACDVFDRENAVIEEAVGLLFQQYPENGSLAQVLLKVVSLNRLYSTQILAVMDVAKHIHHHAKEIDAGLSTGSPELVEMIGLVTIDATGKERYNYSFATKYCSWHNAAAYPIWDSRVDRYLWQLQKQEKFAPNLEHADLWVYPRFCRVMNAFRSYYKLESFTFKQIDKFLWSEPVLLQEANGHEDKPLVEQPPLS